IRSSVALSPAASQVCSSDTTASLSARTLGDCATSRAPFADIATAANAKPTTNVLLGIHPPVCNRPCTQTRGTRLRERLPPASDESLTDRRTPSLRRAAGRLLCP